MKRFLPLLLVIVVAFGVRAVGLNYGLPFAYHDDEPIIVNYALAYSAGDLNPHAFRMSPLISYLLFFVYGLFFVTGYILGIFHNVKDFAYLYLNDPTAFYLIGRILFGAICGTASVGALYALGRRCFDAKTALLGALFLALNYLHVRDSHYIYFDIPLTLCGILFFIKASRLLKEMRIRDYVQFGVIFGLAISVKYSGVLLIAPFFIVLFSSLFLSRRNMRDKLLKSAACAAAVFATLFISNPFAFLSFREFIRDVSSLPCIPSPPLFHLKVSLVHGCGVFMIFFGILGMLFSALRPTLIRLAMLAYIIFYYGVIESGSSQGAERLVLPIVPFILLFSAQAVCEVCRIIEERFRLRSVSHIVLWMIPLLLLLPSAGRIYYSDALFLKDDTRSAAYRWVKENIPQDSKIAVDAMTSGFPRLEKSKRQLLEISSLPRNPQFAKPHGSDGLKLRLMLENPNYPEKTYDLFYIKDAPGQGFLSSYPDLAADISQLTKNGVGYVILSYVLLDGRFAEFSRTVEGKGTLLAVFSPYKNKAKVRSDEKTSIPAAAFMEKELKDRVCYGPLIKIYKI